MATSYSSIAASEPISSYGKGTPVLGATLSAPDYLARLQSEIERVNQDELRQWADLIYNAWENGRFVFIFTGRRHDGQPHGRGLGQEHAA
ncbi:MAG: hypothetical protein R3C99_16190 [Pirellulaceae bacterium]